MKNKQNKEVLLKKILKKVKPDLKVKNSIIVAIKQNKETEKNKNVYDPGKNKKAIKPGSVLPFRFLLILLKFEFGFKLNSCS